MVSRLRSVPGVGVITATSFVAALDEAERFPSAKQARASSAWCRASATRARSSGGGGSRRLGRRGCATYWSRQREAEEKKRRAFKP